MTGEPRSRRCRDNPSVKGLAYPLGGIVGAPAPDEGATTSIVQRESETCGNCGFNVQTNSHALFYRLTGNLLGMLTVADRQPDAFSTWQPAGDVSSLLAVPLATTSFRVRFTSLAARGTWQVDDLVVDPWVMRG